MEVLFVIITVIYLINKCSKKDRKEYGSSYTTYKKRDTNDNRYQQAEDTTKASINTPIYTKVTGVTFNGRQFFIKSCYKGQELRLIRDFLNVYDSNAIAVYAGENQLGFVKKELAEKLAPEIDAGNKFNCTVETVTGGYYVNWGLNICIKKII